MKGWLIVAGVVVFGGLAYALRRSALASGIDGAASDAPPGPRVSPTTAGLADELAPQVAAAIDAARAGLTASGVVDVPGLAQSRRGGASIVVLDAATIDRVTEAMSRHHGRAWDPANVRSVLQRALDMATATAHLAAVPNAAYRLRMAQWIVANPNPSGPDYLQAALGGDLASFPVRRERNEGGSRIWSYTREEQAQAAAMVTALAQEIVNQSNRVFVQVAPGGGSLTIPRVGSGSSADGVVRSVPTIGEG